MIPSLPFEVPIGEIPAVERVIEDSGTLERSLLIDPLSKPAYSIYQLCSLEQMLPQEPQCEVLEAQSSLPPTISRRINEKYRMFP
jgi:hypothetical protein